MLDLKRMKILREVAERRSFSAAGDALFLSQSAVSQQVATLEREVGMKLLDRTREGPKLTDAGQVLVGMPRRRLPGSRRRSASWPRSPGSRAGSCGSRASRAPAPRSSPRPSRCFTAAIRWSGWRSPTPSPRTRLPRRGPARSTSPLSFDYPSIPVEAERDLDRTLLLTESMHLALPADHPLASRATVPLAELADHTWLCGSLPSTCGEVVIAACRTAGFEPELGFETDDYNVMQGFIAAGSG